MNRNKYQKTIRRGAIFRQMYAAQTAGIALSTVMYAAQYTDAFRIELQRQAARDYANARDWCGIIDGVDHQ